MANKDRFIDKSDATIPCVTVQEDEERVFYWDFSREAARRSDTISTVAWSSEGGALSFSGQSVASNIAQAKIKASHSGVDYAKTTVTWTSSGTRIKRLKFTVQGDKYRQDYC